jgi:hypothetical protein
MARGKRTLGDDNEISLRIIAIRHKTIHNIPKGKGIE